MFPTLIGLGWDVVRTPVWATSVQTSPSGKVSTVGKRLYPIIRWEMTFDLLRDVGAPAFSGVSEVLAVVGLFNAVQGRLDTFLYTDPDFNSVTGQVFGMVSAGVAGYQLYATYENSGGPGYNELVQNVNGTPTLYANGTLISNTTYSIGPTGIVTFSTLPTVGAVLTWSGQFYYRCRFDDDELKGLRKFMKKLWALDRLTFTSTKL